MHTLSETGPFLCGYPICDPCCQNETLLCTWSNLGFWYNIKVYIFPFIMVFEFLKSDNPTRSYAYLNIVVVESIKWRNWLSKFGVCKRANFQCVCGTSTKMEIFGTYMPPEIIKISPVRLRISIWNVHSRLKTHSGSRFFKNLRIEKNHPHMCF